MPWQYIKLKFCTKVLFTISKNTSKFCIRLIEKQCHSDVSWMAPFHISAVLRICCHRNMNMNTPILFKFDTKVQLSISNKIVLRLIEKLRHSDVITVLEDSIFPTYSFKEVLLWQQQVIHTQTFKQGLIYFQESHQIWLNYLSPPLGENLKARCRTPPPPAGQGK